MKNQDIDEQDLAEMIAESSPYLVLIPKNQATILISASSQYRCLCLLKDAKKLGKPLTIATDDRFALKEGQKDDCPLALRPQRLSWLYPMARTTPDKFVRSLNLLNAEKLYGLRKSVEVTTIDRVLCDEIKHLNLRDLPSFYACATGLLSALNY